MKTWLPLLLSGLALVVGNGWLYQNRFEFGEELLPPISGESSGWAISNEKTIEITDDRAATLTVPASLDFEIEDIDALRYVLASSRIRTENATPGTRGYDIARIIFYGIDDHGSGLWKYPHLLIGQTDTSAWKQKEAVFEIYPEMSAIKIGAQMRASGGKMFVDELSLRPAYERASYRFSRGAFGLAWLAWLYFLFRSITVGVNSVPLAVNAIVLGTAFLITVFPGVNRSVRPLLPQGFSRTILAEAAPTEPPRENAPPLTESVARPAPPKLPRPTLPDTPPAANEPDTPVPTPAVPTKRASPWKHFYPHKKIFHILAFGSFVLASCLCIHRPMVIAGVYLAFAIGAETVQFTQAGRLNPGDLLDMGLNILGICTGLLGWLAVVATMRHFHLRREIL